MIAIFKIFEPDSPEPDNGEMIADGTIKSLAEKYLEHLRLRVACGDYSARRIVVTESYIRSFLAFDFKGQLIGDMKFCDAKQIQINGWMLANFKNWTKGSTRGDALGSVLTCFNWLEEQKEIPSTPFRRPRDLRFPRVHHKAMRPHHYRAVMRIARKDPKGRSFRLIFFAAWHAGVRLIEFRQLEPHEIDWESSVVRIPAEKHKTGKCTGEEKIIGIGPRLLSALRSLCRQMTTGQKYVFISPRGKPWSKDNLGRHYSRYREAAGVPEEIKMCAVRHGYAVKMLADGRTSSKEVADQFGHKSTRMVESIYGAETRRDAKLVREIAARAERGGKS